MQHRAVAGELVVLVEDMNTERALRRPVVHRLPSDHGQSAVDAQLGDRLVLDAVRPAPQHLPVPQLGDVLQRRFGQQDHVARGDQLVPRADPAHQRCELLVGHAEALPVAVLQEDPGP